MLPVLPSVPAPPPGLTGWPWMEASACSQPILPSGEAWPRWTVVIPSYNQGRYIEEAIRSILLQGYPDLELIVMDGGSTDETVGVVRKYEPWISHWESCKDRGQSHAINKGFARATGGVLTWVNSDDLLAPGAAFAAISRMIATGADVVGGHVHFFGEGSPGQTAEVKPFHGDSLVCGRAYVFHVSFFGADAVRKAGPLREDLHYAMDYEYLVRLSRGGSRCAVADQVLSHFRVHDDSKTCAPGRGFECYREQSDICRSYGGPRFNHGFRTYWRSRIRYRVDHSPLAFLLRAYRKIKARVSAK